jgi:hypothetical protein
LDAFLSELIEARVNLLFAISLIGEGISYAEQALIGSHLYEITMHVSFQHGCPNQMSSVKLLEVISSEELVVFVKYSVLGFLHFLGQVLKKGTPLGGTSQ